MRLSNAFVLATTASAAAVPSPALPADDILLAINQSLRLVDSRAAMLVSQVRHGAINNVGSLADSYHELIFSLRGAVRAVDDVWRPLPKDAPMRIVESLRPFQKIPASLRSALKERLDAIAERPGGCQAVDDNNRQLGLDFDRLYWEIASSSSFSAIHETVSSQQKQFETAMRELTDEFSSRCLRRAQASA
ncbi:hypothetical protein RJ55_08526 [Drechmeria coniospora]|nr:hypothetical protein RJ55_08526 [Drechmeria coniospora]